MTGAADTFKEALAAEGYNLPGDPIPDGKLYRFPHEDKNGGRSGWYVLHGDGIPAGCFGDWRSGRTYTWCAKRETEFTPKEREDYRRRVEQQKKQRDQETAKAQREAAQRAQAAWDAAQPASPSHPYLLSKQVEPYGLKQAKDGKLIVPLRDAEGQLTSLQTIDKAGAKLFLPGGRVAGSFYTIEGKPGTYYICEGYATGATIHKATGGTVIVALNAGNLLPVAKGIKSKNPNARIVICADDDQWTEGNPGINKAVDAAVEIKAELARPTFHDLTTKPTDFNDLAALEGIEEVKRQVLDAGNVEPEPDPEPETPPSNRLCFLTFGELLREPKPLQWLIKNLLTVNCLALLFAKAGMVKSFLAIAIGMAVATGRDWMGHAVQNSGAVFYIAGEGFSGLPARLKAYALENGITDPSTVPFFVSNQAVQILDPDSVKALIEALDAMQTKHGKPELIILDTLARTFGPGNENATDDMSAFISALDKIRFKYGCAVLIVHHSGLADSDRSRGSSALRAALDFEYKIEAENETTRRLSCTKAKDCEEPPDFYFESRQVPLGWTDPEDGEEVTSIVLKRVDPPPTTKGKSRLTGSRRIAFEVLLQCHQTQCGPVHLDTWREAAYNAGITASTDTSARRKAFQRAVGGLMDAGKAKCDCGYYEPIQ